MPLTPAQVQLLQAITNGLTLKSHRDIDGRKEYRLHALDGHSTFVPWEDVEALHSASLIDSNKKFPSSTFWLTEAGRAQLKLT